MSDEDNSQGFFQENQKEDYDIFEEKEAISTVTNLVINKQIQEERRRTIQSNLAFHQFSKKRPFSSISIDPESHHKLLIEEIKILDKTVKKSESSSSFNTDEEFMEIIYEVNPFRFQTYVNDGKNEHGKSNFDYKTLTNISIGNYDFVFQNRLSSYRIANNVPKFSSYFESGNLFRVYNRYDHLYSLYFRNDLNTNGYTNGFLFSVEFAPKDAKLILILENFVFIL